MVATRVLAVLAMVTFSVQLCKAARKLQADDPTLYDASKMTKEQVDDALAYQRLLTGYAALNPAKPLLTEVSCAPRILSAPGRSCQACAGCRASSTACWISASWLQHRIYSNVALDHL